MPTENRYFKTFQPLLKAVAEDRQRADKTALVVGSYAGAIIKTRERITAMQQLAAKALKSREGEITYFREIWPRVFGHLFYYHQAHDFLTKRALVSADGWAALAQREGQEARRFFRRNWDFWLSYISGSPVINDQFSRAYSRAKTKKVELRAVNEKIERLEEKVVNDVIEPKTYKVWYARLNGEKSALEREIAALKTRTKTVFEDLDQAIPLLTNLRGLYNGVSLEGKQLLLKTGFELGIVYDGSRFRTTMINPALVSNYVRIKEKGLLLVEQPDDFFAKNLHCTA